MPSYAEAGSAHIRGIEQVAAVDDQRRAHCLQRLGRRQALQLRPLGDDHRRVGSAHGVEHRRLDRDAGQLGMALHERIPGSHVGALGDEPRGEDDRGRVAHVVRLRLEGQPEQRDRLPAQVAEVLLELPDEPPLLELVHLHDRSQKLEVVAAVAGEELEEGDVLRIAASRRSRCRAGDSSSRCACRAPCRARPRRCRPRLPRTRSRFR